MSTEEGVPTHMIINVDPNATPPHIGTTMHVTHGPTYARRCTAAIITEVNGRAVRPPDLDPAGWVVGAVVLHPQGTEFHRDLVQDDAPHRNEGYWHYADPSCQDLTRRRCEADRLGATPHGPIQSPFPPPDASGGSTPR